jgi:undecaprenyl-diphosphatase
MFSDIRQSIILGIIQGITEFLPISSSGHLLVFHQLADSPLINNLFFDVILHAGTLLALIIYFSKDIRELIKGFFSCIFKNNFRQDFNQRLSWFLIVGTIPVALAGYFGGNFIENNLRNIPVVIASLIFVGILFILVEKFVKTLRNLEVINLGDSLYIGIAQALSLIPGVSRSGITIVAGMSKKINRESSARFSFLLAIPAIFGAILKKTLDFGLNNFNLELDLVYFVGFLTSFIVGLFVLRFLMNFLRKYSLVGFAIYRFALAIVLFIIFVL